jgi:hypothetical protein
MGGRRQAARRHPAVGQEAARCLAAHLSDVPDASVSERSIIRRASVLTVELDESRAAFLYAEPRGISGIYPGFFSTTQ